MLRVTLCFSFLCLSVSALWSQKIQPDSLARAQSIATTILTYDKTIAGNARIFTGKEYIDPLARKRVKGHPNFSSEEWQEGSISFEGQHYDNIPLQYNILNNKVLVENTHSHAVIELDNDKINYFAIAGHHFVRIPGGINSEPGTAFFDLLFDGKVKVFVRRYKTIKETPDQKVMVTEFTERRKIYLFKDGKYISISNKKSALNAFDEYKQEIKKLLAQQNISFRSTPEEAMVVICRYYDQKNLKD